MNGASADPPPITNNTASSNKIIVTGASQNFFLFIRKLKISFKESI